MYYFEKVNFLIFRNENALSKSHSFQFRNSETENRETKRRRKKGNKQKKIERKKQNGKIIKCSMN